MVDIDQAKTLVLLEFDFPCNSIESVSAHVG